MVRLKSRADQGGFAIPHRVHLIGAGGMHMSAIGQILLARGHVVTGSDIAPSEQVERLRAMGAVIYQGHAASNLGRAELVVTTVAAKDDNPELLAALSLGIPVLVRAEMVQRLIADRDVLAVAGTHGKTTTTTLLALMAVRGGLDPLVLAGGDSRELGSNAREGAGRVAVVEADEYAEAFLQYEPRYAVILNVEADHLDYYGTEERFIEAFRSFSSRVQPGGTLFVCADSPHAAEIATQRARDGARVERFALADVEAEWRAVQLRGNDRGGIDFVVQLDGSEVGRVSLQVPGRHNVSNALGALAMAMRAGVDFHRAAQAASEFTGAHRRFEHVADVRGVTIMDDYAHHPTEVRATLQSARARFPGRRLVACFQPHTYSRSRYLLAGFRTCFEALDHLFVLGTYAAREAPDAGLSAQELVREITSPAPDFVETFDDAARQIADRLRPGDVFFTIGAGDVDRLGPMVRALLEARP
ncbi:MAG: UDP-N-acetylmuramate--L-alanine ligase [Dehalococcoidia bacterium]